MSGLPLLLALAIGPSGPPAAKGAGDKPASATQPKKRRNLILMSPTAVPRRWALAIGYERWLGRRFTVGGRVEYPFQERGYWHLTGMHEAVFGAVWLGEPQKGFFGEASLGFAHQFLAQAPRHSRHAIIPGLSAGLRWRLRNGLTFGGSGGLRWGNRVGGDTVVCTRAVHCPAVREGVYARITADIGYAF